MRRLARALLSGAMLVSASARADDAPKVDNRARAQQLFDSALADAAAGNFAAACPKFLASQEADPKTSTLLNLAACYEKNGQTASAWGAFREAEGLARKLGRADFERTARAGADALEPKLVRLTIEVPEASRVAGLEISRDGAKLSPGEWGVGIPVDPGVHDVIARAEGRAPWSSRAAVQERSERVTVPVLAELPRAAEPPPSLVEPRLAPLPPSPPPSWWTPLRTTGVVALGAGGAGLVAGAVVGLVANGRYDQARASCTDAPRGCPATAVRDASGAYDLAAGATVAFVAGAAVAAGGLALVLLAPDPAGRERPVARGATGSIVLGPTGLGGTF